MAGKVTTNFGSTTFASVPYHQRHLLLQEEGTFSVDPAVSKGEFLISLFSRFLAHYYININELISVKSFQKAAGSLRASRGVPQHGPKYQESEFN